MMNEIESMESESDFVCLNLDDGCEEVEVEVEVNEGEDQGSCSEVSTTAKAGCKRTTAKGGLKRKQKC